MVEGFSLGSYLLLVDYTGRLFREGKAAISRDVAAVFDRLGTNAESWWMRIAKLPGADCWAASSRRALTACEELASRLGVRRLVNLGRCPAQ